MTGGGAAVDLRPFYPPRPTDVRKGDFGRVVVAAGSDRIAGALAFAALAALRAGADLALVVAPRRAADVVAGYAPDLITYPCDLPHLDPTVVQEALAGADALVLGGGAPRTPASHDALRTVVRQAEVPMVLDAEALHALAGRPALLEGKTTLLTPHPGEFQVLTGAPWPDDPAGRADAVRREAARWGATLLVKGHRDLVSDGARVHEDDAGSPYLTKGGYGDLVAGVAGALLARGHAPFDAARAAAWLVGTAGARGGAAWGEGLLASDILGLLPGVVHDRVEKTS